jgi:quercetin 2,3-dioxygenase
MLTLRRGTERGHANHGWLNSFHSFSFADYYDPAHMGYGNLRVLNDDTVSAGGGFGTHSHRDMEIISYVLSGALAHSDSMGNGTTGGAHDGVIRPGDVQRMSAGTGVRHSEFNHSKDAATHFLQIWIIPDKQGIEPSYEQVHVPDERKQGKLTLIAAPTVESGTVLLHADAWIFAGLFDGQECDELPLKKERLTYVHLARGRLRVNGTALEGGDAVLIRDEYELRLDEASAAEVLVFDLKP